MAALRTVNVDLPPGVTPQSKAGKKIIANAKREAKMKARREMLMENATGVAISAGSAYAYGVIEDKLPYDGKVPGTEIGMDLAGGVVMTIAGLATNNRASMPMMYAGLGLALPALRDFGRAATFF